MTDPFWDARYSEDGFAYGDAANDFLTEVAPQLPRGKALCLAEGEGRNAVFLAGLGFDVTAMDQSTVGLQKAHQLAARKKVTLHTQAADLADYVMPKAAYDVVVAIWAHLPPPLRRKVHAAVVETLRPGGMVVLEAYTPAQLALKTGGPQNVDLLMTLAGLKEEFAGLEVVRGEERSRMIHEGKYHDGQSAVLQFLARRPR